MNIRYKIDKDTVFVTDEKGVIRKIPKYQDTEKILVLENEIAVINELIEASQSVINANKTKKSYKHYKKFEWFFFCGFTLFSGITVGAMLAGPMLASLGFTTILLVFTGAILTGLGIWGSAFGIAYIDQNRQLSSRIDRLEKIKTTKEHQVAMMKNLINSDIQQEETLVPARQSNLKERLHEIANLIDSTDNLFGEEVPVCEVDQTLQEIEETTKQKVLSLR